MHICGVFTAPYHPSANGTVERVNQTLANILWKISNSHISKWPLFLPVAVFSYNISVCSTTGHSPSELLCVRKLALPPVLYSLVADQPKVSPSQYLNKLTSSLIKLHTKAFLSSDLKLTTAHARSNATDAPYKQFAINEEVLYLAHHSGHRLTKLDTIWRGPFVVIDKVRVDVYSIKCVATGAVVNCVHAQFLKCYSNKKKL